ncbi:Auxilin-like protein 1 [Linum grandiflorum]
MPQLPPPTLPPLLPSLCTTTSSAARPSSELIIPPPLPPRSRLAPMTTPRYSAPSMPHAPPRFPCSIFPPSTPRPRCSSMSAAPVSTTERCSAGSAARISLSRTTTCSGWTGQMVAAAVRLPTRLGMESNAFYLFFPNLFPLFLLCLRWKAVSRTPEAGESLSEESDDPAKAQYISNRDFYEPVDGGMEFNISYNKASQTSSGDIPNGTTYVAPLNDAFHGYSVKVHKSGSLQPDDEYPNRLLTDDDHLDIDFSGEMMDGWHFCNTEKVSGANPSRPQKGYNRNTSLPAQAGANDSRPQKDYNRNTSLPAQEFVTITALNLKTEPSHLPPPARPPPAVDGKMENSNNLSPSHKVAASERIASDCSPPYFDVEIDASSDAAASAAAMKEAMVKAQAKLKSAKESLERKREGVQRRAGSGSRTGRKDKEGKGKTADQTRNTEELNGIGSDEKEENGGEFFTLTETLKVKKTTNPVSASLQRERNTISPKTVGKYDRESVSSQGSDVIDEAGEWKEAGQFFELVRGKSDQPSEEANNESIPLQNISINGHENKGKKVVTEVLEHQYGRKVKQAQSGSRSDSDGTKLDFSQELIGQQELQRAQEASRREDSEKRSRKHWQRPVEAEKKHTRGDGFLRHDNVVEIHPPKIALESKQVLKHGKEELLPKWAGKILEEKEENIEHLEEEKSVNGLLEPEENEKKQKEVQEREDKETKRREALEMEENGRRLKEDLEREEHERGLQEAVEREKNEGKLREATQLEESERRRIETLKKEEIKRREAKAIEQAENEKRQREATELAENEKREREACQREETEKRLREAFEMEEEKERRSRDEASKSDDNENVQNGDLERDGTDEKVDETFELEESVKCGVEEVVEQVVEGRSEELYNVELLQKLKEEERKTNTSNPHEVEERKTSACQTEEPLDISQESLECEEMFVKHEEFDDDGPEKGQNEAGEPQSISYQDLDGDKKLEEPEVGSENTEALGNEENEEAASNPVLGEKLAAESVDVLVDGRPEVYAAQCNVQPEKHHILNTGRSEFLSGENVMKREAQHDKQADGEDIGSASSLADGGKFVNDKVEQWRNINKEENRNDDISAKVVKESMEAGRKTEATHPVAPEVKGSTNRTALRTDASETMQSKMKKLNQSLPPEGVESARLKREKDIEMERLRKMEEEWEREREREKDRMAVDRAILESREKAERAAAERAMKEARERLEKACAEARGKPVSDKTSDAKLRAERAAVEKANAEARERAFERARAERLSAYANNGLRQCTSFSDLHSQNASSANGLKKTNSSVHSGTYNGLRSETVEGESAETAERCKARLERYRRTADRAAKALAEKNMRDVQAQREQAERNRLAESLDAEIRRWSSGKEGNLRALLSTLQYILGQESGWQPIPLTEVITAAAVKKAYRKATLCVHPDKLQQRGASIHQKYICEKVFDLLKEAWSRFNSGER